MKNTFGAVLALATAFGATGATALEITYSTHLPPSNSVNAVGVVPLFEAVAAEATTPFEVKFFFAGALFDTPGNFEAVRDGAVTAAFTQPQSNQADMPINSMFADMNLYGADPYVTAAAHINTILLDCPRCLDEYAANGAMFFGAHAAGPAVLMCAKPITSMDDLRGVRIMAPPGHSRWAQALGGTRVDVSPPQRMEAMQRGQAECTASARDWLTSFSIADATNTVFNVPTGSQFAISFLTFGADAWTELPQDVRDAILRNMPLAIERVLSGGAAAEKAAIEAATERGITVTDLDGAYQAKFDEFMAGQLDFVYADARSRGVENPEEIVEAFMANIAKWQALVAERGTENFGQLLWDEIYSKVNY